MGKTQSKEEIIIAQAGNSGGATAQTSKMSHLEIAIIVFGTVATCVILFYCCSKAKKQLEKKIRLEIRRSQDFV